MDSPLAPADFWHTTDNTGAISKDLVRRGVIEIMFEPKSGMMFETNDGRKGFFIDTPVGLIAYFLRASSVRGIDSYSATPGCGFGDTGTKITKVYDGLRHIGTKKYYDFNLGNLINKGEINGAVVWERSKEVKELTLQEVADKFGIPVEQLRIKD